MNVDLLLNSAVVCSTIPDELRQLLMWRIYGASLSQCADSGSIGISCNSDPGRDKLMTFLDLELMSNGGSVFC